MIPLLKAILEVLQRMGPIDCPKDAWLVGGMVRDMLIERPTRDVDIVLRGDGGATPGVDGGATPGVDIFTVARGFADRIGGVFFVMSERFPTARVIKTVGGQSVTFDFSALRGESIEEDLRARDFTINAMALPLRSIARLNSIPCINSITRRSEDIDGDAIPGVNVDAIPGVNGGAIPGVNGDATPDVTGNAAIPCVGPSDVIDVTGGLGDLKNGVLRMVSRANLVEDPLRLLRAYRFSCELGFTIDAETVAAVEELKGHIERAAPERITAEFLKMLPMPRSGRRISAMAQSGLLFEIIHETARMKGVTQGPPHHLDVFDHTMAAYFHAEKLIGNEDFFMHGPLREYLDAEPHRRALLKLAMLLHDVGKPLTRAVTDDGKISFRGHEEAGARAANEVCARLKTSGRQADYVTKMVREHSRILRLFRQAEIDAGGGTALTQGGAPPLTRGGAPPLTRGAVPPAPPTASSSRTLIDSGGRAPDAAIAPDRGAVRFMRDAGDDLYGLIVMSIADNAAKSPDGDVTNTNGRPRVVRLTQYCRGLIALYEGDFKRRAGQARFLNGGDLIARYRLSPSPLIGEILDRIELATLQGAIQTHEEALAEAEKVLTEKAAEAAT